MENEEGSIDEGYECKMQKGCNFNLVQHPSPPFGHLLASRARGEGGYAARCIAPTSPVCPPAAAVAPSAGLCSVRPLRFPLRRSTPGADSRKPDSLPDDGSAV